MNPLPILADKIVRSSKLLAYAVETTPAEYHHWKPVAVGQTGEGRTIVDQLFEVGGIFAKFASIINKTEPVESNVDSETVESSVAIKFLSDSAESLSSAILAMDPERLSEVHDLGWAKMPIAFMLEMAHNNAIYHFGQVNYMQLLLGDKEFHMPPGFLD